MIFIVIVKHILIKIKMNRIFFAKIYKILIGRFFYNPFTKEMIEKELLFIHIPKSGGTSIATAAIGKPAGHPYLFEYYLSNKKYTKDFFKFCVVRNPYDRLVSAFAHISQRECNPEFKTLFKELNINSFDDLIVNLDNPKTYQKLINVIVHFRSQNELIYHKNVKMDEIFRFEEFDSIQDRLNKKLKTRINLKKLNCSPRKNYREYYNEYSISVVERIYKKDLELFDYKF